MSVSPQVLLAISGASGAIYAQRVLARLRERGIAVGVTLTEQGRGIVREELGEVEAALGLPDDSVTLYRNDDFTSPFATGAQRWQAVLIVPCSMGMLGRIAAGVSVDLITRAADVALKERRQLILVPRETPLSLIHLRNMTALTEAGAVILPPCPGFYQQPATLDDLVDFVAERILAQVRVGALPITR